ARLIEDAATRAPAAPADGSPAGEAPGVNAVKWEDLVAKVEAGGQHLAAGIMRLQIRPIAVEEGSLRYSRNPLYRDDIAPTLREALAAITGTRWLLEEVPDGEGEAAPSIAEREEAAQQSAETEARAHPLVQAAFAAFPGAEIIADRDKPPVGLQEWRNQA
ncbi:MAG: DNA polymerase III subunit gamma/tau, partial [Alphaproteobacteria bacterium]|nr:DNA polymerase III subunit gamma/tau [Alphaproteobacteria bacterium]